MKNHSRPTLDELTVQSQIQALNHYNTQIVKYPSLLQDYINLTYSWYHKDVDALATAMLSTIAANIGNLTQIMLPDGTNIAPNLQTILVANTGEGKSSLISRMLFCPIESEIFSQAWMNYSLNLYKKVGKSQNGNIYLVIDTSCASRHMYLNKLKRAFFEQAIVANNEYCLNMIVSDNPHTYADTLKSKKVPQNSLSMSYFFNIAYWEWCGTRYDIDQKSKYDRKVITVLIDDLSNSVKNKTFDFAPKSAELALQTYNKIIRSKFASKIGTEFFDHLFPFIFKIGFLFHVLSKKNIDFNDPQNLIVQKDTMNLAIQYVNNKIETIEKLFNYKERY